MMRWLAVALMCLAAALPVWADYQTGEYTTVFKNGEATSAQTDATIWDPPTDHRFVLQGCWFSSDAALIVQLEVSDVDVVPPIYMTSFGTVPIGGTNAPIYVGAEDAILTLTTSNTGVSPGHARFSYSCWGWEERVG